MGGMLEPLRLEDDSVGDSAEEMRLDSLPLEMLLSILAHVTPAETLRQAPAVCKTWQSAVSGASEALWMPQLAKDYPLFCEQPLDRSAREVYDQARSGAELPVQVLHPGLTAGTFGATFHATARYRGPACGDERLIVMERGHRPKAIDSHRLRSVEGSRQHAPLEPSFAALQPGEMVELQWKKGEHSHAYNWWFALVHRVVSDDEVQLFFPQYGSTPQENGASSLVGVSTLHRTRETSMHGGIAGGIRKLSPARVVQWWRVLGSAAHDTDEPLPHPSAPGPPLMTAPNGDLTVIRKRFMQHLPREQPSLSLVLAGATEAETSAVVRRHVPNVFGGAQEVVEVEER